MKNWIRAAALLLAFAQARGAQNGTLFLDLGGRTSFWDRNHRFSMGGGMGLAYGANESMELALRFDYHFMPPRPENGLRGAVEITDWEMAAYLAPYHGNFRPMIGGHLGLVRVGAETLRWSLGMDATALYDFRDRLQVYGILTPSMLLGEGAGEVWLRAGAGVRVPLGF